MAEDKARIGFIGLGLMGHAFTKRLTACGYQVTGYDIAPDRLRAAEAHGVRAAGSAAEAARASDIVHVCVMTRDDLSAAVFGAGGIAEGGSAGKLLIDHSTIDAAVTRDFARRLEEEVGMRWVDAPVSGGPPAAAAGTLAIMGGGDPADIARAEPVLADLGTFTHMGATGAGQVTKMVNQVLVLTNFCVLAEALTLAEAGGVDAAKIPAALGGGYAGSRLLDAMYPRMVARDFAPAGYAHQVLKDLEMVQALARELKVPAPMSGQATQLLRMLNAKGHGGLDAIAVLKLFDPGDHV